MLEPHEAPNLPRLRDGLRRGGPLLKVGRGGRWGDALIEVWRHFEPAWRAPRARVAAAAAGERSAE